MSTTAVETISKVYEVRKPPAAAMSLPGLGNSRGLPLENKFVHSLVHVTSTPATERTSMDAVLDMPPVTTTDSRMPTASEQKVERQRYRLVLASFFWCFFLLGLNDGSIGPLLPVYQEFYHLSFLTVSMIFICNCLGCITSAFLNVLISRRVTFSKILVLGTVFQIIAYSILSGAPPFPVMCIAFYINGMGIALLNAQCNSLLSMLHNPTPMGFAHASYGAGALVAPLISTQFANYFTRTHGKYWALYYTILIGTALSSLVVFVTVLKGMGYEEVLSGMGVPQHEEIELKSSLSPAESRQANTNTDVTQAEEGDQQSTRSSKNENTFAMVLKQVHVHILAAFVFIYVGTEVTIGGWIVTFMINERGGGPSSGYVSSGFFGGLALGRVALLKVTQLLGERNAIFLYITLGVILEITIWFVPSLIGNAIAVSLVGMTLGPFYPIVMSQTGRLIPRKVLSGSIGWIAGFGQSGSAVLPFITGALANKYGIIALQPLIVAMMASMAALWFMVPNVAKRRE